MATNRMKEKIDARTTMPMAAIARTTVVDRFGTRGPRGAGPGVGSMDSALDGFPALRAELHVPGHVVTVWALPGLRRAAFPTELESRRDGLAALDARLAPRGHGRVGSAVPAEFRRRRVHRAALRAGTHLLLRRLGAHSGPLRAPRAAPSQFGDPPDAPTGPA